VTSDTTEEGISRRRAGEQFRGREARDGSFRFG
jgi:hypothetical protein